jgi:hypothetical protein
VKLLSGLSAGVYGVSLTEMEVDPFGVGIERIAPFL